MALAIALGVVIQRAKRRIFEEKSATFAGCIHALTAGLAREDKVTEAKLMASSLASMRGGLDEEEVLVLLSRASMIQPFRAAATADVLGEQGRLAGMATMRDDGAHEEVWSFIDEWKAGDEEPRDKFGDAGLTKAQYQLMAKLLRMYRATFDAQTVKIFSDLQTEKFLRMPA